MLLLGIRHRQQQQADCLVACAAMVLDYLGIKTDYQWLQRKLGTSDAGTPFSNIERLQTDLNLFVETDKYGVVSLFERYLDLGLPVIVGVQTIEWAHWHGEITDHAVVVVGIDQDNDTIYIHDPFFSDAPIAMSLLQFQIGWTEGEGRYAVVALVPPE